MLATCSYFDHTTLKPARSTHAGSRGLERWMTSRYKMYIRGGDHEISGCGAFRRFLNSVKFKLYLLCNGWNTSYNNLLKISLVGIDGVISVLLLWERSRSTRRKPSCVACSPHTTISHVKAWNRTRATPARGHNFNHLFRRTAQMLSKNTMTLENGVKILQTVT